jgi:hypothetical protein
MMITKALLSAGIIIGLIFLSSLSGFSQTQELWVVATANPDPLSPYQFAVRCAGTRESAQDFAAADRLLGKDEAVHALPFKAFLAQQAAGLFDPTLVKFFSCGGK